MSASDTSLDRQQALEPAFRARIEAARRHQSLHRDELDALLAELDESHFAQELEHLIEALGTLPIDHPKAGLLEHTVAHSLPGGSRISRRYLHELDRYPPMTRADEVAGAKRLEFALERLAAAEFRPAAVHAARRLDYQRFFNEFVERNLYIVVSEVYRYRTYCVPLDDLVQEGNAALIHAVEKFDWRKGVRFRTYLVWWIRQAVERQIAAQKGAVRVPHHLQQKLRRLRREGVLAHGFDSQTSVADVAKAFDVNHRHASHLMETSRASLSIDQAVDDGGEQWKDLLAASVEPTDPDRQSTLKNRIGHLLADLDEREQTVLKLRFGLDGRPSRTLDEIGKVLHLSRERSRQIQQAALVKLRVQAGKGGLEDEI